MIDATIAHPTGVFIDLVVKNKFADSTATSIASHLNSIDYEGSMPKLTADDVQLSLVPYSLNNVRIRSLFRVRIEGPSYPDHLTFYVNRSLRKLGHDLKSMLEELGSGTLPLPKPGQTLVSVKFIPSREAYYVTV